MHDLVKVSAETANALCIQKTIPSDKCAKIKVGYNLFRQAWPVVDDALIVYMKAPAGDTTAATAFNIANAVFIKDYTDLMAVFTTTGILKGAK